MLNALTSVAGNRPQQDDNIFTLTADLLIHKLCIAKAY